MAKFEGSPSELKALLEKEGIVGAWRSGNGCERFETDDNEANKGILNFWSKKGSYNIQGKGQGKANIETALSSAPEVNGFPANSNISAGRYSPAGRSSNKVFVVYGHNQQARTELEAMLRKWGLEPIILDDLPSNGQTIIEKLENYTADVGFAVVLATADDEGFRKGKDDEKAFRARQNVILELGMLLVKLGRPKVAVVLESNVNMERPSDIQGLIYIPFKSDLKKEAGNSLAKEMLAQGYDIQAKDIV